MKIKVKEKKTRKKHMEGKILQKAIASIAEEASEQLKKNYSGKGV